MHQQGYTWVDVRSEPEFALGHPPGALNVPFQRPDGDRLVDNDDFTEVMLCTFGLRDPLLLTCASGVRSARALRTLSAIGYKNLAELAAGFSGRKDAFGRTIPGWVQSELPTTTTASERQGYAFLLRSARLHTQSRK